MKLGHREKLEFKKFKGKNAARFTNIKSVIEEDKVEIGSEFKGKNRKVQPMNTNKGVIKNSEKRIPKERFKITQHSDHRMLKEENRKTLRRKRKELSSKKVYWV